MRRFERIFELFDAVRIDHFLGFTRTWSIPAGAANARSGRWVKSPGFELFAAVERQLGPRPMIAEDLGHVTPADIRLRDAFGLAPMRIFQFGFGTEADSADHLPHNYPRLCAAYPGNHDNDTTVGWFQGLPAVAAPPRSSLHGRPAGHDSSATRLRALFASPASLVICPLQDVLGLDSRARMNVPGTVEGNWSWRHAIAAVRRDRESAPVPDRNVRAWSGCTASREDPIVTHSVLTSLNYERETQPGRQPSSRRHSRQGWRELQPLLPLGHARGVAVLRSRGRRQAQPRRGLGSSRSPHLSLLARVRARA